MLFRRYMLHLENFKNIDFGSLPITRNQRRPAYHSYESVVNPKLKSKINKDKIRVADSLKRRISSNSFLVAEMKLD